MRTLIILSLILVWIILCQKWCTAICVINSNNFSTSKMFNFSFKVILWSVKQLFSATMWLLKTLRSPLKTAFEGKKLLLFIKNKIIRLTQRTYSRQRLWCFNTNLTNHWNAAVLFHTFFPFYVHSSVSILNMTLFGVRVFLM